MFKLKDMQSGYYNMTHENGKVYLIALTAKEVVTMFNNYWKLGFTRIEYTGTPDTNKVYKAGDVIACLAS